MKLQSILVFQNETPSSGKGPISKGILGMVSMLLLLVLLPILSLAQQSDTSWSTLDQYMQEAARNNSELRAHYHRYLAALEEVPQVNALPDPVLSFGYFISPIETRIGPQQARIELQQMFPWFGTLGARGEAASEMAKAEFEAFQEERNRLFFRVQKIWYQLYQVEETIRILQENIQILETFETLATQRYETGRAGQVDVLRVQIEKEDLKNRLELIKDNRMVTTQQFNELLNRSAGEHVVIPDSLLGKTLYHSTEELEQAISQENPRLSRLDYEASSARSAVNAARKDGLPSFGVNFNYIITGERDADLSDNGRDAIMASATIKIPLFRGKYRSKEQQAKLRLQAVQDKQLATENRLKTQLEQALRDYNDARRRVTLYNDNQIQRTRQAINILVEQYTASDTDFEELLRLQRKLLDYELALETALADQNTAIAYLEYLYGKYNINSEEI